MALNIRHRIAFSLWYPIALGWLIVNMLYVVGVYYCAFLTS
jgi:hypothetical protein